MTHPLTLTRIEPATHETHPPTFGRPQWFRKFSADAGPLAHLQEEEAVRMQTVRRSNLVFTIPVNARYIWYRQYQIRISGCALRLSPTTDCEF